MKPPGEGGLRLPSRVEAYLADIVRTCAPPEGPLTSVVLFGSAASGGYSAGVSDVDLLLVLRDDARAGDRRHVREVVSELEVRHGLAKPRPHPPGAVEAFAERITANVRAFFICTRADLLSGEPARILDIPPAQARFVDRVAIPSIVASGATVWGEDLRERVPLPPIRRFDVAKAFFNLFNQVLLSIALYPLLPTATRYAMDALKRSLHSCYFCYHLRTAPLAEEVAFFQRRHGGSGVLMRLLALRGEYRSSFGFAVRCLPTIARLHARTAWDNSFPRTPRYESGTPGEDAVPSNRS